MEIKEHGTAELRTERLLLRSAVSTAGRACGRKD